MEKQRAMRSLKTTKDGVWQRPTTSARAYTGVGYDNYTTTAPPSSRLTRHRRRPTGVAVSQSVSWADYSSSALPQATDEATKSWQAAMALPPSRRGRAATAGRRTDGRTDGRGGAGVGARGRARQGDQV